METRWLVEDTDCVKTMGSVLYFEQFKADGKTPMLCFDANQAMGFETEEAGGTFMDIHFPKGWREQYAVREHGFG
jgi:hypothetical protein